ncbi:uncharacterized protein LOC123301625 [Chrysoperla carnea]|uniref:uncharacterized protein LOC123301625 n=1 Tax=Chrysoperla carnea TaxID=189513 RepID=UPI001D08071A|nr:uncharacterized protein LOC123301625 [Chrysoperla carnea]
MKFIVLTLAFVCLAQNVFGAPNQASTAEVDTSNIEALFNNFNNFIKDGAKNILGEDAVKHMQENTNLVVSELNKMMNDIKVKSESMEPEAKKVMEQFQAKLNENLDSLKKAHPDAAKMQEAIEKSMKNVIEETKNFGKNMSENSKGMMEDAQKMAKETFEKLIAAAKETQAKYLEPKKP